MPASRRRHLPMTLMALFDEPMLHHKAPTSPPAGVDHLHTTNLMRTIRMPSHKESQHQINAGAKGWPTPDSYSYLNRTSRTADVRAAEGDRRSAYGRKLICQD